jgi:alkylation response protein AidB-like acyl-CoA dehydrogenase
VQPSAIFTDAEATRFGQALIRAALLAVAADCIGSATSNFAQVVAYLSTRQQFGKPIGSFQALKHRCANHTIALETCRELLAHAVTRADSADGMFWARLAKAEAAAMAVRMAEDAIQLHGGVGFTWEFDCHLHLKRAKLNQVLFGREAAQFDHAAALAMARGGAVLLGDAA